MATIEENERKKNPRLRNIYFHWIILRCALVSCSCTLTVSPTTMIRIVPLTFDHLFSLWKWKPSLAMIHANESRQFKYIIWNLCVIRCRRRRRRRRRQNSYRASARYFNFRFYSWRLTDLFIGYSYRSETSIKNRLKWLRIRKKIHIVLVCVCAPWFYGIATNTFRVLFPYLHYAYFCRSQILFVCFHTLSLSLICGLKTSIRTPFLSLILFIFVIKHINPMNLEMSIKGGTRPINELYDTRHTPFETSWLHTLSLSIHRNWSVNKRFHMINEV